MVQDNNVYLLYLAVKPRITESKKAYNAIRSLMNRNPGADVKLVGASTDSERVFLSFEIKIPISNTSPTAISGLQFVKAVFETLFDYFPVYTGEPTKEERTLATQFSHFDEQPTTKQSKPINVIERRPALVNA